MSRKDITGNWTRDDRNAINNNFTELYREYVGAGLDAAEAKEKAIKAVADSLYAKETAETTRDELTRIIREQTEGGDVVPEVVRARGKEPDLGSRLNLFDQHLAQKVDEVVLDESTFKFYANGTLVDSFSVAEAGNASAVQDYIETLVSNGQIEGVRLGKRAVKPSNTTFIKLSSNLFNIGEQLTGYVVSSTDGTLTANGSYNTSELIEVTQGDYSFLGFGFVAIYDQAKNFISRESISHSGATLTLPENAHYIRASYQTSQNYLRQVNEGSTLQGYEDWSPPTMVGVDVEVENRHIQPNAVSIDEVDFVAKSTNLFVVDSAIKGKIISSTDGSLVNSAAIDTSEFISVLPTSYYYYGFNYVAYYDKDFNFITRNTISSDGHTEKPPINARYVRLSYSNTTSRNRQMNQGTTSLPYEKGIKPYIRKESVTLEKETVINDHITDDAVQIRNTDFIKESTNLFNVNTSTPRYTISSVTGEPTYHRQYRYSDYIKVKPLNPYSFYGFENVVYYDKNKNFIERVNLSRTGDTKTTYSNVHFVRLVYNTYTNRTNEISGLRMNEGSTLLPYEPYENDFDLELEPLNDVIDSHKDTFMIDLPVDGVFNTNETYDDYTNWGDVTVDEVYQMFDDLMATYPDYITKEFLGNEATGLPVNVYYIKPSFPEINPEYPTSQFTKKIPKIFLTCGVHGSEKATTLTVYLMIKQMFEKWKEYPLLEVLRFNCEFVIMPIGNPWGWNNKLRKNSNNVDINRNMPFDWDSIGSSSDSTYGGTAPLSELEAQYIKKVFDDNSDIDIMYDYHNFFEGSSNFIWIPVYGEEPEVRMDYVQHMAMNLITRMSRKWQKEHTFIPEDSFVGYSSITAGGLVSHYAKSVGIKYTGTFEICYRWTLEDGSVPYNETMVKTGVEALVNWLLINLRELTKY